MSRVASGWQQQHDPHMPQTVAAQVSSGEQPAGKPAAAWTVERGGMHMNIELIPSDATATETPAVVAGEDVNVRIALSDAKTGTPLTAAVLGVWVDRRETSVPTDSAACFDKVQGYVRGTLQVRPAADLNSYFVLALNNGNNISVIDPFLGFGSSKLYTTIVLNGMGEDWALDAERDRLFVSMPLVNQVAVVSTVNWKVQKNLDVGTRPTRIVLQPDGRYVWVTNDGVGDGGSMVTVIDAATAEVVTELTTGSGPHEFEFVSGAAAGLSDDAHENRLAFITNREGGTVSVVDVSSLTKVADIKTGARPIDIAYSSLANAVYVAHEGDGSILAIDARSTELQARIGSSPGLKAIAFDHSGRWGFVVNGADDAVYIIDAATATVRHALSVPAGPDQVSFTRNFAYVRSTESVDVTMIPLSGLEADGEVAAQEFPTGQLPPAEFGELGRAQAIVSASRPSPLPRSHPRTMSGHDADAVYVPNPADKSIYYYHYMEGMPTPSGRLDNYGFEPKAVLVVGHDLQETELGVYTTTMIAPPEGEYDVVFLLDEPRVIQCFEFAIAPAENQKRVVDLSLKVEPLWDEGTLRAGAPLQLEFKLSTLDGEPVVDVEDAWVMVYATSGRKIEQPAEYVGDGTYTVSVTVPDPGVYSFLVMSPSLGLRPERQVPAPLRVVSKD